MLDADELVHPHIEAIFRLLVVQHPAYGDFRVVNQQWAWARKNGGTTRSLKVVEQIGVKEKLFRLFRRIRMGHARLQRR